jgi:hypothetical protein
MRRRLDTCALLLAGIAALTAARLPAIWPMAACGPKRV